MSSLTLIEKQKLERELGMKHGYVLGFSNRTFDEFFQEVVGVGIYDNPGFAWGSGSKANRMRAFWQIGTDEQVSRLLVGLRDGWELYSEKPIPDSAKRLLDEILARLGGVPIPAKATGPAGSIDPSTWDKLNKQLLGVSELAPQERGYEFERFLNALSAAFRLSPRPPFRLRGEQIDGSFSLNNETYLLEARWQNEKTGAADLHAFQGKLEQKAAWSRGLFLSYCGFSEDGIHAFGRRKSLIGMHGLDLSEMLRLKLSFADVVEAKVRHAAETGNLFVSVRELFPL